MDLIYISRNGNPEKNPYISENRNSEKILYISGNGTFSYFRKRKPKKTSYISGSNFPCS